ncbi:hypothetical protein LTR78_001778 [Recurvomyces mirabilis]|uniref:Uncharacterized protein n=1 Tax=Recurvomyces mirabilis TaxID=574656 RepID=A0AAE0WVB0_9PEZI|nr:hypothetical protein LTR78_001778 [Recurvomyces mirabilis]KAK5156783.1 hypothetical protein LTS14_004996 [Recurvomyces mirabilis]
MNESTQNDVIGVGEGGGRRGEDVEAGSSTPAVAFAASVTGDAVSEGEGGAEWQMVTTGKAKAGGAKRAVAKSRPRVAENNEGAQQTAHVFVAVSTAERKWKAEKSVKTSSRRWRQSSSNL